MREFKLRKVVIIGAGHVGSHCALSLATQGMADEIVLLDLDAEKAAMQALDVDDAVSNLSSRPTVRGGSYDDCGDADLVVMAAGKKRLPGQTRLDMFDDSIHIMQSVVGPLKASGFHGVLISISNPADIVADYLRKRLGLPDGRVFSTGTSLDSARLRRILERRLGVDRHSIRAYCMGEHGDSQFIPVSRLSVGGEPIDEFVRRSPSLSGPLDFDAIARENREAGVKVIEGKGCTEFGIGAVLCDIAKAVLHDEKRVLPVSTMLSGEYGQSGVQVGVPAVVGAGGVERVLEVPLTDGELARMDHTCRIVRGFIERADAM